MRIVIVLENYWPHVGGVETLFQHLAEGLVKKRHKVDVVTHRIKGTPTKEEKNGVKIHRVKCFGSRYLFTFLSIPKAWTVSKDADIIHTTTFNGAGPAWLVSRLRKKPCIITIHEVWIGNWHKFTDFSKFKAWLHNFLESAIFKLSFNKYIAVSESTRKQLLEIGILSKKIKVVYNGLDYSHFNPQKHNRLLRKHLGLQKNFVCLSYGRLGPSKGFKYAVKTVPELSKAIPNFKYLMILSKDKQYKNKTEALKKAVENSDYKNSIMMLEPVSYKNIPKYIKASDCVLVPSLAEGFGYTVAESCAMNVPVVATNTTSIPEVISNKFILVPPKSPSKIAAAVKKVWKKQFKESKPKKFTWEKTIDGYIRQYKMLK